MTKQRLVENFFVNPKEDCKPIPLTESKIVVEGKEYKCVAAYTFPISRPGKENLNGRVYESALWEGVIKRQEGEGSFGLCDHPPGSGSVKDSFCVWHNIRFNEDRSLVVCDAYLFGKWGLHAKEAIDAGGRLGMSSVGLGEYKKDGKTIDESSYELIRPADWVMDPSYQVFGGKEDEIKEEDKPKKPVEDKTPDKPKEKQTPSEDASLAAEEVEIKKSQIEENRKMKLEENLFRIQMEGVLKGIKEEKDLLTKKVNLQKNIAFFEENICPELKEEFVKYLSEVEKQVQDLAKKGEKLAEETSKKEEAETKLEEKQKEIDTLKEENESIKTQFEEATVLADSMKEVVKELQSKSEELENALKTSFSAEEVLKIKEEYESKISELEKKQEGEGLDPPKDPPADPPADPDEDVIPEDVNESVKNYYLKMREAYPAVVKIKEELLGCKTLAEAQKKFINLRSVVFESPYRSSYTLPRNDKNKKEEGTDPNQQRKTLPSIRRTLIREGWE